MKRNMALILALILTLALFAFKGLAEAVEGPEAVLAGMTAEQKVAQLLMPTFRYYTDENGDKQPLTEMRDDVREMLEQYGFAGVICFVQNTPDTANAVRLIDAMQAASAAGGHPQLLVAADQEGGYVTRLGRGTQMPGNMALGAIGDTSVTEAAARLLGEELSAVGFNYDAAPVVDVNNNPANPVINNRSFSDDPEAVSAHGVAFMKGLQSTGLISTLKHFPGHGDTDVDSHTGLPRVDKDYEALKACELIPFQACIDAGAEAVMTAHIQYPSIETGTYTSAKTGEEIHLPATLSKTVLTDILRGDMGFGGVVITDAMNMDAIREHFDPMDAAKLAIEAGVDILLMPVDTSSPEGMAALGQYVRNLAAEVDAGEIDAAAVDAAVGRVLALKAKHGLLDPYDGGDVEARAAEAAALVGSKDHHAQEWEIARRSLTLLKNDGVLPIELAEGEKAVVIVPFASQVMSVEYAAALVTAEKPLPEGAEIVALCLPDTTIDQLKKAVTGAKVVICVSSVYGLTEMQSDGPDGLTAVQYDAIHRMAHACAAKTVIISTHIPYDVARYPQFDAALICWSARGMTENPLEAGDSVAQYGPGIPAAIYTLLTDAAFEGKLPITIPTMDETYEFTDQTLYARGATAAG